MIICQIEKGNKGESLSQNSENSDYLKLSIFCPTPEEITYETGSRLYLPIRKVTSLDCTFRHIVTAG